MPVKWLLLAAAIAALMVFSNSPQPTARDNGAPLLPRPGFLHALFAAQQQLVADYYWAMTTHQVGKASTPEEYRDAYYYADLATDLDPKFRQIYWFAGVGVVMPTGRGTFANVDESDAILKKGIRYFPNEFKLHYQLAQNELHFRQNYKKAADMLREVAKLKDAPSWLPSLATKLYAQSGAFEASLELAKQMVETAEDDETRLFYQRRVKEIRQELILRRIDREVLMFKDKFGRLPRDINELIAEGYIPGLPADPLGGWYYLNDKGRAFSTASNDRLQFRKPGIGL